MGKKVQDFTERYPDNGNLQHFLFENHEGGIQNLAKVVSGNGIVFFNMTDRQY